MKYRDKGSFKFQEKQMNIEDGTFIKSQRTILREQQHRLSSFYSRYLINKIDKFWWQNLKDSDKERISSLHALQFDYLRNNDSQNWSWYSCEVFDTWDEWYDYIKTTFETNKVKFREDKLKVIGI